MTIDQAKQARSLLSEIETLENLKTKSFKLANQQKENEVIKELYNTSCQLIDRLVMKCENEIFKIKLE
jgi:hypothetical protein